MKTNRAPATDGKPSSWAVRWRCIVVAPLLLWLQLALPLAVQAQFTYTTSNGAISITGYSGPGGAVTIPDTINGLPVRAIAGSAFANQVKLTSVTIANSVVNIGDNAFSRCTGLTGVTIGNGITRIGNFVFSKCTGLTNVTIPDGVISIWDSAFSQCTGLISVTIPSSVTSIERRAFSGCTGLSKLTLGNSVTRLESYAFVGCTSLTSVRIPDSVTFIGSFVFSDCIGLTNVMIGNGVTSLGAEAFSYCSGLIRMTIPKSVTSIGSAAFYACPGLKSVYFEGTAPTTVGSSVFGGSGQAIVHYLPGITGWKASFADRPTEVWNPHIVSGEAGLVVETGQFGFNITWASGKTVVVEAASDLAKPSWSPLSTNTLTGGTAHFSDPEWANQPARLYRLRTP